MNRDRSAFVSSSMGLSRTNEDKYFKGRMKRDSVNGGFDMKSDRWSKNGGTTFSATITGKQGLGCTNDLWAVKKASLKFTNDL